MEAETTGPGRERYYVRKMDQNCPSWSPVDRSIFARCEGQTVAGMDEDVRAAIAAAEGVPVECIRKGYAGAMSIIIEPEHIASGMEYVRRTGLTVETNWMNVKWVRKYTQKNVVPLVSQGDFVVDNAWIRRGNGIRYNPSEALKAIQEVEEWRRRCAERRETLGKKRGAISKIPRNVLSGIVDYLAGWIQRKKPFNVRYAGWRPWGSRNIVKIEWPRTKEQSAQAAAELSRLCVDLYGEIPHRNFAWKQVLSEIYPKYRGDVLMKGAFGRLVREEFRVMQELRVRPPKKWGTLYAGEPHEHSWIFGNISNDGFSQRCSQKKCFATRTCRLWRD
jgi:hypothetical protein